jgi:hypothetical protein
MEMQPISGKPAFPPSFDDESPDAAILEAFEMVRAMRAFSYADDPTGEKWTTEQVNRHDADMVAKEEIIRAGEAATPAGVAARLLLAAVDSDQALWIDQTLAEHGVLAVHRQLEKIANGCDRQVVIAAYELIQIEWSNALTAYERSTEDFTLALKLNGMIETYRQFESGETKDFFALLDDLGSTFEHRFCNNREIDHLFRTLAPSWDAYRRKAEIAIAEGQASEAAPWLLRDANFIMGGLMPTSVAA